LRSIGSNIRDYNPSRCIVVFDGKGGSQRRRKIFSEYKQNRTGKYNIRREEFLSHEDERASQQQQLIRIIEYLDEFPIQVICLDNVEADDCIAYMVQDYFTDLNSHIRILSTDRDFLQLVSDRVEVYSPVKKKLYSPDAIKHEFGFHPNNYLLYRVLTGDNSDNIDGIRGLALKTLMKQFPELADCEIDWETFVESINLVDKPKKSHESILSGIHKIARNYQLMQLQDVDIAGTTKLRIIDILNQSIQRSNSVKFKRMLIEDYIGQAFKYPDDWLMSTFSRLNQFAGQ
jgi:5'-3' exonuclease